MMSRRPFLILFISLSFGIVLGRFLPTPFYVLILLSLITLSLGFLFLKNSRISMIFVFLSLFLMGMILIQNVRLISKNDISNVVRFYRKAPAVIEGVVVSDIKERNFYQTKKSSFELQVKRIKSPWGWKEKSGKILVHVFGSRDIVYGDYLKLQGKIYPAFDFDKEKRFSYKDYLLRKGIRSILSVKKKTPIEVISSQHGFSLKAASFSLRKKLKNIFNNTLSKNQSAIMKAIILGDRKSIPSHIQKLFARTGSAHILAISGLHIGIIAFLVFFILKLFPMKRSLRFIFTTLFLFGYCFLVGGRLSVVRATLMASVFLLSFIFEKESDVLNSLFLAGFLILLLNPFNLFDAGFQLSFISVFSILCLYPMIANSAWVSDVQKKAKSYSFVRFLIDSFLVSLSVWLGVLGLVAYYFQIITPVTVLTNLFVIPCIGVIITLGLTLILMGTFVPQISFLFAWCIKVILNAMVGIIYLMEKIPGAYFEGFSFSFLGVFSYYVAFFLLCFLLNFKRNRALRQY